MIIDSTYLDEGTVFESHTVTCDAIGGTFGLQMNNEIVYVSFEADDKSIKASLETLSIVDSVTVVFSPGLKRACSPGGIGNFTTFFESGIGPFAMKPLNDCLLGAGTIDISVMTTGNYP